MSLSSKRGKRTYPFEDVTICLDAAAAGERDALTKQRGPAIAKQIKALEERMRSSLLTVRVVGVDYAEYMKVQRAHPRRSGTSEAFNPETFYSDFIYKNGFEVEDDGSLSKLSDQPRSDWDDIAKSATTGEINALAAAVEATNGHRVETGFLSRGSASTEPSSQTSELPESGE